MRNSSSDQHTRNTEFVVSQDIHDPEWDHFVLNHPDPHHEQTSLWGSLKLHYGWQPSRIIMRSHNEIVGGVQILELPINKFVKVGYISRGPLLSEEVNASGFLTQLKEVVKERKLTYVALSLPYSGHSLVPIIEKAGFIVRPKKLPPTVWTKATVVINLDKGFDAIFADFRSTVRKHIRRGQRAGIVVREGNRDNLPRFEELMLTLCRRRGVGSNIPGGEFLGLLWDAFSTGGNIKLLNVKFNNEVVSSLILMVFGRWVRAWRIGWSGNYQDFYPNEVLYWEAIRWAKINGYKYFDLSGIEAEDAVELLAGRDKSEPFKDSITFFKMGFGGKILLLPGEYCYFPTLFLNPMFRFIGRPLLESRFFSRFAASLYSKSN